MASRVNQAFEELEERLREQQRLLEDVRRGEQQRLLEEVQAWTGTEFPRLSSPPREDYDSKPVERPSIQAHRPLAIAPPSVQDAAQDKGMNVAQDAEFPPAIQIHRAPAIKSPNKRASTKAFPCADPVCSQSAPMKDGPAGIISDALSACSKAFSPDPRSSTQKDEGGFSFFGLPMNESKPKASVFSDSREAGNVHIQERGKDPKLSEKKDTNRAVPAAAPTRSRPQQEGTRSGRPQYPNIAPEPVLFFDAGAALAAAFVNNVQRGKPPDVKSKKAPDAPLSYARAPLPDSNPGDVLSQPARTSGSQGLLEIRANLGVDSSFGLRVKTSEEAIISSLSLARRSGNTRAVGIAEAELARFCGDPLIDGLKAKWKGVGILISATKPFVIEDFWMPDNMVHTEIGDVILAVSEIPVDCLTLREVNMLIRGPPDDHVVMEILRTRDGHRAHVKLTRVINTSMAARSAPGWTAGKTAGRSKSVEDEKLRGTPPSKIEQEGSLSARQQRPLSARQQRPLSAMKQISPFRKEVLESRASLSPPLRSIPEPVRREEISNPQQESTPSASALVAANPENRRLEQGSRPQLPSSRAMVVANPQNRKPRVREYVDYHGGTATKL